ncbi:hypothetical protein HYU22_03385 [Candidatus Woesearchaeota archaeon]|nr:hypothetical protein [Candidatus Woesearchaeota archaeon]
MKPLTKLIALGTAALLGAGMMYYCSTKSDYEVRAVPPAIQQQLQQEKEERRRQAEEHQAEQRRQEEEHQRLRQELHMTELPLCGRQVFFPESASVSKLIQQTSKSSLDDLWGENPDRMGARDLSPIDELVSIFRSQYHSAEIVQSFYFGQLFSLELSYPSSTGFAVPGILGSAGVSLPDTCSTGVQLQPELGSSRQQLILYHKALKSASEETRDLTTGLVRHFQQYTCPSTEEIVADVHPSPGRETIRPLCREGSMWVEGFQVYDAQNNRLATWHTQTGQFLTDLAFVNVLPDALGEFLVSEHCRCQLNYRDYSVFKFRGNGLHNILDVSWSVHDVGEYGLSYRPGFSPSSRGGHSIIELEYGNRFEGLRTKTYLYNPRALRFERQP